MLAIRKSIQFGNHKLTLETGVIAKQATASVKVDLDDTTVLVTVVGSKEVDPTCDFFPLRVDYQEKSYACGKIPGGFFKREGRPSERETLIARLIDRPIRPLFPKGFNNDVQVVANVISMNPEVDPDIPAMIGASAALALSGMPISETMGAARVGYSDGFYTLNPTKSELKNSQLDLVVAGTSTSVLMVESEASELTESVMLGAVMYGQQQFKPVIDLIEEFAKEAGKDKWQYESSTSDDDLLAKISDTFITEMQTGYQIKDKMERQDYFKNLKTKVNEHFAESIEKAENSDSFKKQLEAAFANLQSKVMRGRILEGELRIDGRDTRTVRPITVETGVLPRTHGSALFTRGETQALVVTTLGSTKDAQIIDNIFGEEKDNFMLHYNFPPYSVGEIGMVGSPKRREIGHGKLAKRGIASVMPDIGKFPYVVRVVSEITESNGSSSMASICGSSLSLMDAGVPISAPVAGIAMGLIKDGNKFAVLTDILGDEDHLGDMDFKVAGTSKGITALQMDIKISGITEEIMTKALAQAKDGRIHILEIMNEVLSEPKSDVSKFAPRIDTFKINPDKIKDVIGKGGATIRSIVDETGVSIDIQEDGTVQISSTSSDAAKVAKDKIDSLTSDVEIGKIYQGKVARIADFGAFVNILPGKDGLVHISQIADRRIAKVTDELELGQEVKVKVLDIDKQGRVKLSMRAINEEETQEEQISSV